MSHPAEDSRGTRDVDLVLQKSTNVMCCLVLYLCLCLCSCNVVNNKLIKNNEMYIFLRYFEIPSQTGSKIFIGKGTGFAKIGESCY